MRKSCKRNEKIGTSWKVKKRTQIQAVIAMPEMDEEPLVVCVNHPQAGMLKRIFRSTDLFQNIYDWVGSLYHLPEYFELSKVTGEIIFPSDSLSKAEKCVLYMQERDDPLSLHENDSKIEFTDQAPTWDQLYNEIETSWVIEFNIITSWSSKEVL